MCILTGFSLELAVEQLSTVKPEALLGMSISRTLGPGGALGTYENLGTYEF